MRPAFSLEISRCGVGLRVWGGIWWLPLRESSCQARLGFRV